MSLAGRALTAVAVAAVCVGAVCGATDFEGLRRKALDRQRLIIWDDDGCDMTHYPYQRRDLAKEPASVRNFEHVFLEATEGTKADVIGYSGVMGFGYFTALKSGADVNTNRFAGAHEPWRNAVNEFAAMGHDAMEMAVAHAHRNGKECFFSLRFNDNHDNGDPDIMLSPFKRQNPEVMVGHERKVKCCGRFAADFAQEKVRTFVKKYIRGYLENYDLDGIEYDFFRHPQLFRTVALGGHATEAELRTMTMLMQELRAIAEEIGRKRGRPFVLCARVPDSLDYCKAIGIDLERWAKEGVIDFLVVGGYFQLEPWRKTADLVHGWGLKCYASIDESRIERVRGAKFLPGRDSKECWLARVAAAMASGMDGVNLFNIEYFDHNDQKYIMGHDIRDLDGVEKLYFATYTGGGGYWPYNFLVGGDGYWKTSGLNPARPVGLKAGERHRFDLVLGDDIAVWRKRGKEPVATVKLLASASRAADITLIINGSPVVLGAPVEGVLSTEIPADGLKKGDNAVEIVARASVTLHDFSLRLGEAPRRTVGLGPVIYNTDGCDMLDYPVDDPITYASFIAQRLGRDLPGSAVTAVGYCPVSSGFGHFTALKVGDTLLNPLPPNSTWRGRKVYNATGDFAKKGLDALEMGLRYSRSMGCATIASIRMNDTHDQGHTPEKPYFLFSPFKVRHPEFLMGSRQNRPPFCAWSAVDYTHPEVREAMLGYVRQLAENYDFDALDLDFFRHVQYFKSVAWGAEAASAEECEMMTALVRDIRAVLNQKALRQGRRVTLIARTPDSPGYCRAAGLDVERWLGERLVDVWVGSGYFRLQDWRESAELAHRYGAKFYASLDESRVERHCARLKLPRFTGRNSRANFAARVAAAAEEGCDGIEFFNIDDYPDSERKAIAALAPGLTDGLDKDYFLVNRGSGGYTAEGFLKNGLRFRKRPPVDPGRRDCPRLKPNEPYAFEMTVADDFAGLSKAAKVTAEVLIQPTVAKDALPVLIVNGKDVGAPTVPKKDVITYAIPVSALKRGANAFSVKVPAGGEFRDFVLRVRHKLP